MSTNYKCVTTVDGIKDYLGNAEVVAFDYETAPNDEYRSEERAALDPAKAHIVGCSFSVKEYTGIYVPVAHLAGENIEKKAFYDFLHGFLSDRSKIKVAHNIAFESAIQGALHARQTVLWRLRNADDPQNHQVPRQTAEGLEMQRQIKRLQELPKRCDFRRRPVQSPLGTLGH